MWWVQHLVVPSVAALGVFVAVPGSPPVVIDTLSDPDTVAAGTGWGTHPDQTAGGASAFVEGPATPPLGRGSMELTVDTVPDRALVFAVPNAGAISPWSDLSASFSTLTFSETNVEANLPTMRFQGFQQLTPAPTNFTTLNFAGGGPNGAAIPGEWQTWDIGPDAVVFQSNNVDGFCTMAARCTLSEFAAQYPDGGWGLVQLGIGSGAPAGARGFVDAVTIMDGPSEEFAYDFETTVDLNSTASVQAGAATTEGGEGVIMLNASTVAADSVVFTITVTLPDGSVETSEIELPPGATQSLPLSVPFGTTNVTVEAQGMIIASGDLTFAAPSPPPAAGTSTPAQIAATGVEIQAVWLGLGLFAVGGGAALLVTRTPRSRPRSVHD